MSSPCYRALLFDDGIGERSDILDDRFARMSGLKKFGRHRDIYLAAGIPVSIQGTTGSEIAFAAIAHLGQTVPPDMLRCILDLSEMFTTVIAQFDAEAADGRVSISDSPGLRIDVDQNVLGEPEEHYT